MDLVARTLKWRDLWCEWYNGRSHQRPDRPEIMKTASQASDFAIDFAASHDGEEWNRLYMEGLDRCGYRLEPIDDDAPRPFGSIDAPAPSGFKKFPPRKPGLTTACGYPYPSIIVLK